MILSVHSVADAFLDWFTSLQSPVIPEKCTSKLEKGEKINSEFVNAFMSMVRMKERYEDSCHQYVRMYSFIWSHSYGSY